MTCRMCGSKISHSLEPNKPNMDCITYLKNRIKEEHKKGKIEGIILYAYWKDGTQYVGTCGTTLRKALADL